MGTWDVQVRDGAKGIDISDPDVLVTMGTPRVKVGEGGGLSDPGVDLIYSGVHLKISGAWAMIYRWDAMGSSRSIRIMEIVSEVALSWEDELRIVGAEKREDGALVRAVWIAEQHIYGEDDPPDAK